MEPFKCSESKLGSELIYAIITADMEKIKSLIEKGASVNERIWSPDVLKQLSTPLQVAINNSNLAIVNLLLSEGADPNMRIQKIVNYSLRF